MFNIEQIIALSQAGFTADQIGKFQSAQVQPVQPVQRVQPVQQVQPIQPVQPVQQVQPVQPIQPVQPVQSIQPAQPVQPVQPIQPGASALADTSLKMLELVQQMQSNALAAAGGTAPRVETAEDVGLGILNRGEN